MARWLKVIDDVLKVKVHHLQTGRITNSEFADWVDKQPTIEAAPVKHGKWEEFDCDYGGTPDVGYYCSECGHAEMTKYPYCNCGAKMDQA